jgi:hypothetical protein
MVTLVHQVRQVNSLLVYSTGSRSTEESIWWRNVVVDPLVILVDAKGSKVKGGLIIVSFGADIFISKI